MEPFRTFRETSRTAKNPANSLVNPWVSRMNSSAKQTSPVEPSPRSCAYAADYLFAGWFFPDVLERLGPGRLRGGICRHRSPLGKAESAHCSPLARRPASSAISRIPAGEAQQNVGRGGCGSGRRKAFLNGLCQQDFTFIKNLAFRRKVQRLEFKAGAGHGFRKRKPDHRQIDQAARSAQYLAAAICPGAEAAFYCRVSAGADRGRT